MSPADGNISSFMQSAYWARFKSLGAWGAFRFDSGAFGGGESILVLTRSLGAGFFFAYVPMAPKGCPEGRDPAEFLKSLGRAIAEKARIGRPEGRLLFVRFDLPWERNEGAGIRLAEALDRGDLKRGSAVQVPDTVILDLGRDEEALLSSMKPKWRYNIRLAAKKGVVIERKGREGIPVFYGLYEKTAARDGIGIHPIAYYESLFEARKPDENTDISVWIASHEGEPLASIVTIFAGGEATYLYGASSDSKRNLMPAYALQWAAIQAARAEGCLRYDFFGIPPDDDPDHPMAGLYLFKTGFGGRIVHRVGSVDYPVSGPAYSAFRAAERVRLFWFKKLKKTMARVSRERKSGTSPQAREDSDRILPPKE